MNVSVADGAELRFVSMTFMMYLRQFCRHEISNMRAY